MVMLICSSICMTSVEVRGVQQGGGGVGLGLGLRGLLGISLFWSLASKAYRLAANRLYYLCLYI
jgi:hypothetical protein